MLMKFFIDGDVNLLGLDHRGSVSPSNGELPGKRSDKQ